MTKPDTNFAMAPEKLAEMLSASSGKLVSVAQVVEIAESGNLLSETGTLDLIRYTAYLIGVIANAE